MNGIFDRIQQERGGLANIHTAFASFPQSVEAHYEYYKALILPDGGLPLSRLQREALAFFTSQTNECPYCIGHHKQAYENFNQQSLPAEEISLFRQLAATLSKEPWKAHLLKSQFIDYGFKESQWQHAVVVVAYFNMANRLAFAMDLDLEDNFTETCK